MGRLEDHFKQDINDIEQIPIVRTILDVVCQTTGMGFSAVARVTEDRWITCSVRDDIGFGLKPGDELEIKTTICNEIRESGSAVIIDHVDIDEHFSNHHTPAMYGFQSYISVPIIRKDGTFFGTLCAIDPAPHVVSSPHVKAMFTLFTDLISFHLHSLDLVKSAGEKLHEELTFKLALQKQVKNHTRELEDKSESLERMNKELQAFAYISSHDLQEPLRKIQTIASAIADTESNNLSEKGKDYFRRMREAAARMQSLINDLLAYSRTAMGDRNFETTNLDEMLGAVQADLATEILQKNATIYASTLGEARVIPFQFRQLLYNLIVNSLKFARPEIPPEITITTAIISGSYLEHSQAQPGKNYLLLSVADNGIGFEQKYNEKIFEIFQRLHDRNHYSGTGIGLTIVKKIVENHNGYIVATGQPDKGASFDIFLPIVIEKRA